MIPRSYTYLAVDLGCLLVPLLATFHPKIKFYTQWRYFLWPCMITAAFFINWDVIFTRAGVWQFNNSYVLGYYFINLPVEELLFFIFIPYACTFTFYCCNQLIRRKPNQVFSRKFAFVLGVSLAGIGCIHLNEWYTSVTFLLLSAMFAYIFLSKAEYTGMFFVSFVLILIPFFISNGILTGTGLAQPVVIYNNHYNLGIRLGTIPVEDVFYGMLLQLMNVAGMMWMKKRQTR